MTIVSAGSAALLGALVFFMVVLLPPYANQPMARVVIPVFSAFIAIFGALTVLALTWKGARQRAWFWLAPALPAVLLTAMNARQIPHDLVHPASTNSFLVTIVVVAGAAAVVLGSVAAFLDVRRGRASWKRSGRAGFLAVAIIGAVVGAAGTSLLAGWAAAGGEALGQAAAVQPPTTTAILTVEEIAFVDTNLEMKNGEVLGLFIVNDDGLGHSFDVDSLGIHVELPANSTTAVTIKPTGPGALEFYCSIPGHKGSGMVGTISVE